MSKATLFNLNIDSPAQIHAELYQDVGASTFQLGTYKRGFYDVQIYHGADSNDTLLQLDIDYTLEEEDSAYTDMAGFAIYTGIKIINATYQVGDLFISYKCIGTYTDKDMYENIVNTLELEVVRNSTVAKTASYAVLNGDGYTRIECDTTAGDITITLPAKASNARRQIEIANVKGGTNKVIINPHADDANTLTNDALGAIWLPKIGDFIKFQESADSGYWEVINERITSQLRLNTYAGYGSTDSKIMRFTNVDTNIGNMFSENHVSGYDTNKEGLEITANRSGRYSFSFYSVTSNNGYSKIGLSINSAELTTDIPAIATANRLTTQRSGTGNGAHELTCAWVGYLAKGDIIRAHTDAYIPITAAITGFTASYLGN
jgi:hypothetical protein